MPRTPRLRLLAAAGTALVAAGAGCGDDGGPARLGDDRAGQVRTAALDAGLDEEVADVLALAARGTTATFRITYPGEGGAEVIVSQEPPNARLDVVVGDTVLESHVVRDGVTYRCEQGPDPAPDGELECERDRAAVEPPGAFSEEALADFARSLGGGGDRFDISVEERTIADTAAVCLVTAPKAGTPIDGSGPGVDTLCLSPEGAQLLTDSGGERVVAASYTTEVPEGTFQI